MTTAIYPEWQTTIRQAQAAALADEAERQAELLEKARTKRMTDTHNLRVLLDEIFGITSTLSDDGESLIAGDFAFSPKGIVDPDKDYFFLSFNVTHVPLSMRPGIWYSTREMNCNWMRHDGNHRKHRIALANILDRLNEYTLSAEEDDEAAAGQSTLEANEPEYNPAYYWLKGVLDRVRGNRANSSDNLVLAVAAYLEVNDVRTYDSDND